jgi:hypothetical protein
MLSISLGGQVTDLKTSPVKTFSSHPAIGLMKLRLPKALRKYA